MWWEYGGLERGVVDLNLQQLTYAVVDCMYSSQCVVYSSVTLMPYHAMFWVSIADLVLLCTVL